MRMALARCRHRPVAPASLCHRQPAGDAHPHARLTTRMVAAWLLGFGLAVVLAGREGDLGRLDIAAPAYGLLAVLELVVLARYPETVRWDSPAAWVYLAVAVSILVSSAYGLSRIRRARSTGRRRLARQDGLP